MLWSVTNKRHINYWDNNNRAKVTKSLNNMTYTFMLVGSISAREMSVILKELCQRGIEIAATAIKNFFPSPYSAQSCTLSLITQVPETLIGYLELGWRRDSHAA